MDRTCAKCNKAFDRPYLLKRHQSRKTPCEPIVDRPDAPDHARTCKYCGRSFSSNISMYRHVRDNCKIANSEEGMDKLVAHTLQRQLAEQGKQIAELTILMKQMAASQPAPGALAPYAAGTDVRIDAMQINAGPVTNTTNVQNTTTVQINIRPEAPWDSEKRINVSVAQIVAAFAENTRLKEYIHLEEHQLTDPEIAPPYVAELLMDLTKRAHADPTTRNVYLNPRRADQALVHMASGKWEVMLLVEATRLIFDGVAKAMVRVTLSNEERRQLPLEAQNALAMAGLLYDDEPDEYAKKAKAPMAVHLANTAPRAAPEPQLGQ